MDTPVFTPLSAAAFKALPRLPWRVKGILSSQGLATIYGPPASGKSFLAIDLAAAIAAGNDSWFGFRVRQAPVTYVVLEGEGGFQKRIEAWERANECNMPDNLQFVREQLDITDSAHVRQLATVIKRWSVVFIDTMARAANGKDENSSEGMGSIIAGCKLLQSLTDCLVVLIHHTGKDVTKGMRGHSSLLAAVDAAIEVLREDDGDIRTLTVAKNKDGEDGASFQFQLSIQLLGHDEDGDPVASCAVEQLETVPVMKGSKLSGNKKLVYDALSVRLNAGCGLIDYDEALKIAIEALAPVVDPGHRSDRASYALNALIKSRKLVRDSDSPMLRLPELPDSRTAPNHRTL